MDTGFKNELTQGGLNQRESGQAYRKLREAAFPHEACRTTCTTFNDSLHDIHDAVVTGALTVEEGLDYAAGLRSVDCAGDPPQKDIGHTVVARCVAPTVT